MTIQNYLTRDFRLLQEAQQEKERLKSSHETLRYNKVSNMKPNITTSQKHVGNHNFSNLVQFSDKAALRVGQVYRDMMLKQ